jgi:hypothetical protein
VNLARETCMHVEKWPSGGGGDGAFRTGHLSQRNGAGTGARACVPARSLPYPSPISIPFSSPAHLCVAGRRGGARRATMHATTCWYLVRATCARSVEIGQGRRDRTRLGMPGDRRRDFWNPLPHSVALFCRSGD